MFKSRHFSLDDLTECSDAWRRSRTANIPKEDETYRALENLCRVLLDPLRDEFGDVTLTYGFCSPSLQAQIDRGISPKHDQHASYEKNRNGHRVCSRGGAACDFFVPNESSLVVAKWVVGQVDFDRLYYYGALRPIHVSVAPASSREIVLIETFGEEARRIPRRISEAKFLELRDD